MPPLADPRFVCSYCGETYGRHACAETATWHIGECDVCGDEPIPVTDPRGFGGLNDTWKEHD